MTSIKKTQWLVTNPAIDQLHIVTTHRGQQRIVATIKRIGELEEFDQGNAHLLSAAPEMLDALDPDMLEAIANELTEVRHSARAASLRAIASKQRNALAKANASTRC